MFLRNKYIFWNTRFVNTNCISYRNVELIEKWIVGFNARAFNLTIYKQRSIKIRFSIKRIVDNTAYKILHKSEMKIGKFQLKRGFLLSKRLNLYRKEKLFVIRADGIWRIRFKLPTLLTNGNFTRSYERIYQNLPTRCSKIIK